MRNSRRRRIRNRTFSEGGDCPGTITRFVAIWLFLRFATVAVAAGVQQCRFLSILATNQMCEGHIFFTINTPRRSGRVFPYLLRAVFAIPAYGVPNGRSRKRTPTTMMTRRRTPRTVMTTTVCVAFFSFLRNFGCVSRSSSNNTHSWSWCFATRDQCV